MQNLFSLFLIYIGIGVILASINQSDGLRANIQFALLWPLHVFEQVKARIVAKDNAENVEQDPDLKN